MGDPTRPTPDQIATLVHDFYDQVREDPLLGPVFERHLHDGWDPHLERMIAFWSNVLLGTVGFQGNPVRTHRAIAELRPDHFDRWLELFAEVTDRLFEPTLAREVQGRAARMRVVLERHLTGIPIETTSTSNPLVS
jgi:hemoglobin